MTDDQPELPDRTVLVVDDEPEAADFHTAALEDEYEVLTAYSGESALEMLGPEVGVVLLDRRMPGLSGDEVLERIRERDFDGRVVMVTAVDPDPSIVELPFDDYVTKPVSAAELRRVVERMLVRETYDARIREIMSLASTMATLEAKLSIEELEESEEYANLQSRFAEMRADLEGSDAPADLYPEFTAEKIRHLFG